MSLVGQLALTDSSQEVGRKRGLPKLGVGQHLPAVVGFLKNP